MRRSDMCLASFCSHWVSVLILWIPRMGSGLDASVLEFGVFDNAEPSR